MYHCNTGQALTVQGWSILLLPRCDNTSITLHRGAFNMFFFFCQIIFVSLFSVCLIRFLFSPGGGGSCHSVFTPEHCPQPSVEEAPLCALTTAPPPSFPLSPGPAPWHLPGSSIGPPSGQSLGWEESLLAPCRTSPWPGIALCPYLVCSSTGVGLLKPHPCQGTHWLTLYPSGSY